MQWTKFAHLIKRCLKKCFLDGNVFNKGFMGQQSPLSVIDTEQLIKYIEKLVHSLQTIEKVIGAIFSRKSSNSSVMKEAHLQIIEVVSESSL